MKLNKSINFFTSEDDDENILDVTKVEEDMEISNITDAPTDDVPTSQKHCTIEMKDWHKK